MEKNDKSQRYKDLSTINELTMKVKFHDRKTPFDVWKTDLKNKDTFDTGRCSNVRVYNDIMNLNPITSKKESKELSEENKK